MPGVEQESCRSEILTILWNARRRYVLPTKKIQAAVRHDDEFDVDSDDESSCSSLFEDFDELVEGIAKGDTALYKKTEKATDPSGDELQMSFSKDPPTYKAPLRRTDFSSVALCRRSLKH